MRAGVPNDILSPNQHKHGVSEGLALTHLPTYARFISDNHLAAYVEEQLMYTSRATTNEVSSSTKDEITTFTTKAEADALRAIELGDVPEFIRHFVERWLTQQAVTTITDEMATQRILLANKARKNALLQFLPLHTNNVQQAIEIMKEIDAITQMCDTAVLDRIEKKATEQLTANDAVMHKVSEMALIGSWTWDLATGKIEWSDELYAIYGLPRDFELTFDNVMAFTDVSDHAHVKHNLKLCRETLQPRETHYHITLNDGTKKVLHAKTEVITNAAGDVITILGIIQDVTEKQLLIERLQRSEQLHKQAQAISHIGNWSWDLKTRNLTWSDEIYRIYELEPAPVTYSGDVASYNHPDDASLISARIGRSLKTLEPFDFTYRIILKNGKQKTLHSKGEIKTDFDGVPITIFGTIQDITDQKLIEKQLKDSREFANKIANVTPSIIAAYNIHTGKYTFINKAIETLLGYPASKILQDGVPFFLSIIHPDDVQPLMEQNTRALEEANRLNAGDPEPIVEFRYRLKNSAGEYRWIHTYGTVFERNADGLVDSVLNVSVDVTAQEVAEHALFQKNIQLQQSNASLEEYAYVASHDLKEPLRKISTFSDRLLSLDNSLSTEARGLLGKIINSANRMQQMINDLLSVSTISGNEAYQDCDLNAILNEAIQALDYKIEESHATVEADQLPHIYAIPAQFRQLFQNLISNSLKFARKDVPPHIRVSCEPVSLYAADKLNLRKSDKYLQIEVTDNGIGFDNEYANKIFAIFARLHSKSEYEGTGIGLAICKKIVENHGGIISASGVADKGAVFTIIIPGSK